MPFANHPKEEVIQINRPIEIPGGHTETGLFSDQNQMSQWVLSNCGRQDSGPNRALGSPDHITKGMDNRVEWKDYGHEVRECWLKFDSVTCSSCDIRQAT